MRKKQRRNKKNKPSYSFPLIALFLSTLFILGAYRYARREYTVSLPPGAVAEIHPAIAKPVAKEELSKNVINYKLSEVTSVKPEAIKEKTNLNRKMITPKSDQDIQKIKEIVEARGGKLIETNQSTIVVELPDDTADEINQILEEQQVAEVIEVDYPTFVLAETDLWNIQKVDAPRAWEKTKGAGVKVGVIDTGVDYTHPELQGRFAGGYDNVNEDDDPMDGHGHGTHVAGIIAANLNGRGVAGISPEVSLYAYKAVADNGLGYTSDLIESIDSAINDGIQTVNISLGTQQASIALENKLNEAVNKGMVIVGAAGNTGGGAVLYPAAYSSVISVSATDQNDQLASFSSLGGEISAPGVGILSTIPGGSYTAISGTSMAAPHVTATAALLIANGTKDVRQTLYDTTLDLGPEGPDGIFGYGLLQTGESIVPTEPTPTPEIEDPTTEEDEKKKRERKEIKRRTATTSSSVDDKGNSGEVRKDVNRNENSIKDEKTTKSSGVSNTVQTIINTITNIVKEKVSEEIREAIVPEVAQDKSQSDNSNSAQNSQKEEKQNSGQGEENKNKGLDKGSVKGLSIENNKKVGPLKYLIQLIKVLII